MEFLMLQTLNKIVPNMMDHKHLSLVEEESLKLKKSQMMMQWKMIMNQ